MQHEPSVCVCTHQEFVVDIYVFVLNSVVRCLVQGAPQVFPVTVIVQLGVGNAVAVPHALLDNVERLIKFDELVNILTLEVPLKFGSELSRS